MGKKIPENYNIGQEHFKAEVWNLFNTVDRYSYSGVAFSATKGLDLSWCKALEVGLPTPDLVLYLDKTAEIATEHGDYGGKRYEQSTFRRK